MRTPKLKQVAPPPAFSEVAPVPLTEATMKQRLEKVLQQMRQAEFEALLFYADKEHGSNFEYLTGFFPRFEEALLVLHADGTAHYIMGNENLKMVKHARLKGELHHYPLFSLPNQPMDGPVDLTKILQACGITSQLKKLGLVGWKMFTAPQQTKNKSALPMLDLPYFIVAAVQQAAATAELSNGIHLLIGDGGARRCNTPNEIAHYEYGAQLASKGMYAALSRLEVGVSERQLGALLNQEGQLNNVVTIAATGQRFENANFYPTDKQVRIGDPVSLTVSYKGGLSSRTGFAVENVAQLPKAQADYLEKMVYPYFTAVSAWLESAKIGITGGQLYQQVETVYPKAVYGWHLNPGHLTADEEWLASPVYEGSTEKLQSGMLMQLDLIPSVAGYQGTSTEECLLLADEQLQSQLQKEYPHLWQRIQQRRNYLINELGIAIHADLLPLSNLVAYLPPFLLAHDQVVVWQAQ